MPPSSRWLALLVSLPALAPSCAARVATPSALRIAPKLAAALGQPPKVPSCARASVVDVPRGVRVDESSSVALVRAGAKTLAYVADEDDRALRVVDVGDSREVGATELGGAPSDVLVLPDGRVAVSLRDAHAIAVLEPDADVSKPFALRCTVDVPDEPLGMTLANDEATVLVASRWGHALTALDAATLATRFSLDLPRDPRAVVVSADGATAFVSHVSGGSISAVDLAGDDHARRSLDVRLETLSPISEGMPMAAPSRSEDFRSPRMLQRHRRFGGQGYALARATDGRIFAAHTLVEPGGAVASGGYGGGGEDHPPVTADIGVIDAAGRLETPRLGPLTVSDCLLPRAIAVDGPHGRVVVACRGLDSVLLFDERAAHPHDREIGRVKVGAGPTGVAVDPDAGLAYVWSVFDRRLDVVSTDAKGKTNAPATTIAIARRSPPPSEDAVRGRALFHDASARRIAFDGRACASCHPDGRDDGLTWSTPEGPRQTPMLAGRLDDTAPYGWDGARATLPAHLGRTLERLHGTGIDAHERETLFAYIATMKVPVAARGDDPKTARGKEIFDSDDVGCSSCHAGSASTDGLRHDVKSRAALDSHAAFDTPSLRFVGRTAPFFHDGRFATMRELLVASDGKMGHTAQLSPADLQALETYVDSL